jgi:hypothetical protein
MQHGIRRQDFQVWYQIIDQDPFHSLFYGERITGHSYKMRNIRVFAAHLPSTLKLCRRFTCCRCAAQAATEIANLEAE